MPETDTTQFGLALLTERDIAPGDIFEVGLFVDADYTNVLGASVVLSWIPELLRIIPSENWRDASRGWAYAFCSYLPSANATRLTLISEGCETGEAKFDAFCSFGATVSIRDGVCFGVVRFQRLKNSPNDLQIHVLREFRTLGLPTQIVKIDHDVLIPSGVDEVVGTLDIECVRSLEINAAEHHNRAQRAVDTLVSACQSRITLPNEYALLKEAKSHLDAMDTFLQMSEDA